MKRHRYLLAILATLVFMMSLAGCSATAVKVCETDVFGRPDMQFDYRAIDQTIDEHIYFSKEAASGGRGFGGGGCGCN
jgi:hypothetical protein